MCKVSIIIACFNSANSVEDAIQSIVNQCFRDIEIIIVDDGSEDDTKNVVAGIQKKYDVRIKYFYQKNQGPGAARNKGLRQSCGEYISFLDSDDVFINGSIERKIRFLDKNPSVGMVFTDYFMRYDKDDISKDILILKTNGFLNAFKDIFETELEDAIIFKKDFYHRYLTFTPYPISTCALMIRRSCIEKTGYFRTDLSIGEDTDYWLRIVEKFTVGFIDYPSFIYNKHTEGSLTKNKERYYLDGLKSFLSIYNKKKMKLSVIKEKIADRYYGLGYLYFSNEQFDKAKREFLKSIKFNIFQVKPYLYYIFCFIPTRSIAFIRRMKKLLAL